jgi:hypothetical protein
VTATAEPAAKQVARFVVIYDAPSDLDAFERHYNEVSMSSDGGRPDVLRY